MRVLLAHNNFRVTGGAELFYRNIGSVLEKHGHSVAYFSINDGSELETEWSRYFPTQTYSKNESLSARLIAFPTTVYSFSARRRMKQLINDFRPDIVHAIEVYFKLTPSILDACGSENIPVVLSSNDYKLICPNYHLFRNGALCEECKGGRFVRSFTNKCNNGRTLYSAGMAIEAYAHELAGTYRRNVHTYLFASEFMAAKVREFWAPRPLRYRILRNPINSLDFKASRNYENYCLYFGRLHDSKGVNVLIEAMAKCPDAHLKIVGEGPEESNLRDLAARLQIGNVEFLGPKWGKELTPILENCRFVILPAIWYENFPYVINQSFATGKPVIGSNIGGIPELIRDGEFGLLCKPGDANSLSDAIRTLWGNPQRAVEMGINAKMWADREFNDAVFYENLLHIYSDVLGVRN